MSAYARFARTSRALAGPALLVLGGRVVFACDEVYADPITSPLGPTFDAGIFTTPKPLPIPCPRVASDNSPCVRQGLVCEYGESPDPSCNRNMVCASSTFGLSWAERAEPRCSTQCPADPATIVDGAPCDLGDPALRDAGPVNPDEEELTCTTSTATCACTTGPDAQRAHPRRWVCVPTGADCPTKRPLLGQPCFGSRTCDYGACQFKRGMRMICEGDVWQVENAPCP